MVAVSLDKLWDTIYGSDDYETADHCVPERRHAFAAELSESLSSCQVHYGEMATTIRGRPVVSSSSKEEGVVPSTLNGTKVDWEDVRPDQAGRENCLTRSLINYLTRYLYRLSSLIVVSDNNTGAADTREKKNCPRQAASVDVLSNHEFLLSSRRTIPRANPTGQKLFSND